MISYAMIYVDRSISKKSYRHLKLGKFHAFNIGKFFGLRKSDCKKETIFYASILAGLLARIIRTTQFCALVIFFLVLKPVGQVRGMNVKWENEKKIGKRRHIVSSTLIPFTTCSLMKKASIYLYFCANYKCIG